MTRTKANENEREGEGAKLTERQRRAIPIILESQTIEAAARAAGISKTTLYEWMKQDPFRLELETSRAALFKEGMDVLKGAAGKAAWKLVELLDSRNENTRRLTAREVLTLGMKINEIQELERRIEQLEEILAARAGGKR